MGQSRVAIVVTACVLVLTACQAGSGPASESARTLRIGAALSLTGKLAREGNLTKEGYEYCATVINGAGGIKAGPAARRLEIVYQDDRSTPDVAAQLVDEMNDRGVKLLLGPYGSASTEAASAVVERNGQVMVEGAGADDKIFAKGYQQTFGVLSPASRYLTSILKAVAELATPKPKTVAILTADEGFSKTAAEAAGAEARSQGMDVVATETFPNGASDVSGSLTRIKAKNPDLVLVSAHLVEGVAVIKQSQELGIEPSGGFGETVAPPTPDFVQALGPSADYVLGSVQWTPETEGQDRYFGTAAEYAAGIERMFHHRPEYHNAEATAACLALALAVESAGSPEPQPVRRALASLDTSSFFGRITFDRTGRNVSKPMAVVQIQKGSAVTIWPKSPASKPMLWPAPPFEGR
jgi:branched-chain amino acid transport system substrate-binding protein